MGNCKKLKTPAGQILARRGLGLALYKKPALLLFKTGQPPTAPGFPRYLPLGKR